MDMFEYNKNKVERIKSMNNAINMPFNNDY